MASIPDRLGTFNPAFPYDWSEDGLFNQTADFLQHLQQCLHLYCESELLDLLITVLAGPASAWFDDQPEFTSLHDFGIALTKAFPSSTSSTLFSSSLPIPASESTCETFEKSANSCSPPPQKQQRLKIKSEAPKFKKASKAEQAVKPTPTLQDIGIFDPTLTSDELEFGLYREAASFLQHLQQCQHLYRKSDLLNLLPKCLCGHASEWFKTQSEFTSLKRFGRALAKAFPEASVRRASRSSNLQLSTLDVIPKPIETPSDSETTSARVTCKLGKQSFNSNRELYEHIRNHEALKLAKDSSLSINAVNLVCEIEEKPSVTHVSPAPSARPQNSISESATASRSVTLLKRSNLPLPTLETEPEPAERPATCRHCKQTFKFKELLRKHKREQHAKKPAISSPLRSHAPKPVCKAEEKSVAKDVTALPASQELQTRAQEPQKIDVQKHSAASSYLPINTAKSACESMEISTANSSPSASLAVQSEQVSEPSTPSELPLPAPLGTFNPARPHQDPEKRRFNQAATFIQHLQQCQHLYGESELLEWMEVILCGPADTWFGNQPDFTSLHDFGIALTKAFPTPTSTHVPPAPPAKPQNSTFEPTATSIPVITLKRSNPLSFTPESVPIRMENESLQCSSTQPQNPIQDDLEIDVQKPPVIGSPLTSSTPVTICELVEKSAATYPSPSQEPSTPPTTPRNLVTDTDVPLQPVSFKGLHLLTTTPEITPEYAENTSDSLIETAEAAEAFAKSIASIRAQAAHIRVRMKAERAALQVSALEPAPKSMERPPIQQTACARICKRCKQGFNSNNKLHEHIREHHARKPVRSLNPPASAPELTYKTIEKPASICPPAPLAPQEPPTPPATPKSQKSWSSIMSEPVTEPTRSDLPITTYKISPKPLESAVASCSLTPPTSPPRTPVRKHHESHMQKSYLTMDDLSRMFTEKPRPFGLRPHQDRPYSPQSSGIRQSSQPCSSTASKKPYLTIENLSEMFGEKSRRKGMFQGQKNVSSRGFSSGQSRITAYFKPTANQKPSISQGSKSSKPKSLNQHMPAESIRTAFSKGLPEKTANLPYKSANVSCVRNRPLQALDSSKPRTPAETPSLILVLLRLLPAFLLALAFVSAMSATRMGCINAYGQSVSAIGRAIQ